MTPGRLYLTLKDDMWVAANDRTGPVIHINSSPKGDARTAGYMLEAFVSCHLPLMIPGQLESDERLKCLRMRAGGLR